MSNIDWSKLITKAMKDAEKAAAELAVIVARENTWRAQELAVIARQLEAIEEAEVAETDDDIPPDLLPGTRTKWLQYRTKVSNWKTGTIGYPNIPSRPVRPS